MQLTQSRTYTPKVIPSGLLFILKTSSRSSWLENHSALQVTQTLPLFLFFRFSFSLLLSYSFMTSDQLRFNFEVSSHFISVTWFEEKNDNDNYDQNKKTKQSKSNLAKILLKTVNNKTRLVGEQTIASCFVGFHGNAGFTLYFRFQVIVTRYPILRGSSSFLANKF